VANAEFEEVHSHKGRKNAGVPAFAMRQRGL